MDMNLGRQGATRQSWSRDNLRAAILEIKTDNPRAAHETLVRLLAERLRDDEDLLIAAADYAVTNAEDSLQGYERRAKAKTQQKTPEERAQAQAEQREKIEEVKTKILLLNHIMPNGKRMRFCVGTEMIQMGVNGTKECAAWIKIGRKAGTKRVGEVLNEKQVKEILE